jgi:hypothetical protein
MTLFDFRTNRPLQQGGEFDRGSLELDDLLSFGGDDLGLDVDSDGHLVLTEGVDFE